MQRYHQFDHFDLDDEVHLRDSCNDYACTRDHLNVLNDAEYQLGLDAISELAFGPRRRERRVRDRRR